MIKYVSGPHPLIGASVADLSAARPQAKGSTSLNMTMPVNLAAMVAGSAGPNDSTSSGSGKGSHRNILIAHGEWLALKGPGRQRRLTSCVFFCSAVLGSVALVILSPLAVLIARFGRDRMAWFPAHWVLNLVSAILIIITFALGTYATGNEFNDTHQQ